MTDPVERGLQVERTLLAHRRTQLATTVVALLLVREAEPGFERAGALVVAGLCVVLSVLIVVDRRRELRLRPPAASVRAPVMTLVAVGSLQVLGAVLVVA